MNSVDLKEKLDSLDLENILLISIKDEEPSKEEQSDSFSVSISKKNIL